MSQASVPLLSLEIVMLAESLQVLKSRFSVHETSNVSVMVYVGSEPGCVESTRLLSVVVVSSSRSTVRFTAPPSFWLEHLNKASATTERRKISFRQVFEELNFSILSFFR
jgi:hypothetical protein